MIKHTKQLVNMSVAKLQPPRKLTDEEDLDTFEDWWFQFTSYFAKDANFKPILDDPNFTWQAITVENRGCASSEIHSNLTSLLRSMATYAAGPYIKDIIMKDTTCVSDVKREFMRFLEIELSDLTLLDFYQIQRKPNERPLRFYYRLRHHQIQHLLPKGTMVDGTPLREAEKWTPTMERLNIMEWLRRLDKRLLPFIKEKFSTELSGSSTKLITLVETLAKNVDHYITWMNQNQNYSSTNVVSQPDLSLPLETQATDPRVADINFQQGFRGRGIGRGFPRSRPGGRGQSFRGRDNRSARFADCEYCYVQAKVHGKNVDFRHNVRSCPMLKHMFQPLPSVNVAAELYEDDQNQSHPFDLAFSEYENQVPFADRDGGQYGESQ